ESGLDINPRTGVPWAVGDRIELFDPIGGGVDIQDYLTHPNWPQEYSGLSSTEVQKFHKFIVRADTELVSFAQLGMVSKFLNLVKPTHKDLIMIASASHKDDIDIREDWLGSMVMRIQDGLSERLFTYDNYRGDGT